MVDRGAIVTFSTNQPNLYNVKESPAVRSIKVRPVRDSSGPVRPQLDIVDVRAALVFCLPPSCGTF